VRDGEDTSAGNSSVSAVTQIPLTFNPLPFQVQQLQYIKMFPNMSNIAKNNDLKEI
jgi:hypothetical protein